jgi:hypothetical protein
MTYPTRGFRLFATALLFGVAALLGGTAFGQDGIKKPKAPDPSLREVALVKQDFSDCENSNVSPSGYIGGTVWVVRGSDGTTNVKVGITAQRNTTYHFFLKCVRILGDIQTYDEGVGEGCSASGPMKSATPSRSTCIRKARRPVTSTRASRSNTDRAPRRLRSPPHAFASVRLLVIAPT